MVIKGRGFMSPEIQVCQFLEWLVLKGTEYRAIRPCGSGEFQQCIWAIVCGSRGLQNAVVSETLDRGACQEYQYVESPGRRKVDFKDLDFWVPFPVSPSDFNMYLDNKVMHPYKCIFTFTHFRYASNHIVN